MKTAAAGNCGGCFEVEYGARAGMGKYTFSALICVYYVVAENNTLIFRYSKIITEFLRNAIFALGKCFRSPIINVSCDSSRWASHFWNGKERKAMAALTPLVDLIKTLVDASSKKLSTKQVKLLTNLERDRWKHESEEREKDRQHESEERERDRQHEYMMETLKNACTVLSLRPQLKRSNILPWFKNETD